MRYKVVITERAKKQIQKLDKSIATLIIGWLEKNIEGSDNPRKCGKALTANRVGQWRYRVGNYRLICEIIDDKVTILVLEIGHRKDIYK